MLFNSYEFLLLFLPIVLLGWWVFFRRPVYRLGFLAFASYVFYSYFEFPTGLTLLPLMLCSTTVDYIAGVYMVRHEHDQVRRKRALIAALSFNLGLLLVFKYLGFFENTLNGLASLVGLGDGVVPVHSLVLPIGISFYTFNSMSYTIDVYRGIVKPARNALEYAAFVALFPHLIAGPIVRYSDIDGQLQNLHTKLTSQMAAIGSFFFIVGLFKKVIIANTIARHSDPLWANSEQLGMVTAWAAALGYSFQLYFDFSGYSDMAVGLAMLLGLRFPQNFNSPYKALNISDFWNRWHMSLSRWLRDYVFIPLGGSRGRKVLTLRNLFITMFLGGLWHGAAWVFVIWGMGHGLLLVIHRLATGTRMAPRSRWVARAMTFVCVVILWVPFRAGDIALVRSGDSMRVAGDVLSAMFGAHGLGLSQVTMQASGAGAQVAAVFLGLLAALLVFVNVMPNTWEVDFRPSRRLAFGTAALCTSCVLMLAAPTPFLYFQF